jgi:hypothetical protein
MQNTSEIKRLNGIRIVDVVYMLARSALMSSQYWQVQQYRLSRFTVLQVDLSPFLLG